MSGSQPDPGAAAGGSPGGGLDAVMVALGRVWPDDPGGLSEPVLAERMRQLVALRAQVDGLLAAQLRAFDAGGGAAYDGQTSTLAS